MANLKARSFCEPSKTFSSAGQLRRHSRASSRRKTCHVYAFKNFGDGLLDYMEAGPKLRKWYGEGDRKQEGKNKRGPEGEEEEAGDAILVTDADSPIGELVLLQLILARLKVVALVGSPAATQHAYGSYVTPIQGNVDNRDSLARALRKSKAVICTSRVGALPQVLPTKQIEHVVLLSSVGLGGLNIFDRWLGGDQAALTDEKREAAVQEFEAPLTIVRVGKLQDKPGGTSEIRITQGNAVPSGSISREDVAQTLVRALQKRPKATLRVAVESKPMAAPFTNWDQLFMNLDEAV